VCEIWSKKSMLRGGPLWVVSPWFVSTYLRESDRTRPISWQEVYPWYWLFPILMVRAAYGEWYRIEKMGFHQEEQTIHPRVLYFSVSLVI